MKQTKEEVIELDEPFLKSLLQTLAEESGWSLPAEDGIGQLFRKYSLEEMESKPADTVTCLPFSFAGRSEEAHLYLRDGQTDRLEVCVAESGDSEELNDMEYDDRVDQFFGMFEKAVEATSELLGPPMFNDGFGNPGFPKDEIADWLALWEVQGRRVMVQQRHEDRELPFFIYLVVC